MSKILIWAILVLVCQVATASALMRPVAKTALDADGEAIVWLDWTSKLLRPDGSVNDELMLDAVHPAGGYVEWAKALKPYLK